MSSMIVAHSTSGRRWDRELGLCGWTHSNTPVCMCVCVCVCVCVCDFFFLLVTVCLPVCLPACLPSYLSFCLSASLSVCLPVWLSSCLAVDLLTCLSAGVRYLVLCAVEVFGADSTHVTWPGESLNMSVFKVNSLPCLVEGITGTVK